MSDEPQEVKGRVLMTQEYISRGEEAQKLHYMRRQKVNAWIPVGQAILAVLGIILLGSIALRATIYFWSL